MASKPNPSWSAPQKALYKTFQDAQEVIIPYVGPEIPVLDNHTDAQILDDLGVVKTLKKAVDMVEKTLVARFKGRMTGKTELRSNLYTAEIRSNPRVAIDQGKVKKLIEKADEAGINIERLIDWAVTQSREAGDLPERVWAYNETETNALMLNSATQVETLTVKAI